MGEFRMPSLGADMESGTIVEWRVRPGDAVHRGDIVAVVDTDKSTIEVEVFEDGVVQELVVPPGTEVPVGTVLALIDGVDGAPAPHHEMTTTGRASPRARRAAERRGIDLATVRGSGPGGTIVAADVVAPSTPPAPAGVPPTVAAPSPGGASGVGAAMARSKREIPHYYLATTVDFTPAREWLSRWNEQRPVTERILPAALLLKATAVAAGAVPGINGTWDGGFRPAPSVDLGVAVSLRDGGLVAPVIAGADRLDLDALMVALRGIVERARAGTLRTSDVAPATLTVTNLGEQGADEVFAVITPPQVAVVGFGRIVDRPWAVDGLLGVRPTVRVSLSADHRVSDGHRGSRFLAEIDRWLQHPEAS